MKENVSGCFFSEHSVQCPHDHKGLQIFSCKCVIKLIMPANTDSMSIGTVYHCMAPQHEEDEKDNRPQ